jgi:hypothetical protein
MLLDEAADLETKWQAWAKAECAKRYELRGILIPVH